LSMMRFGMMRNERMSSRPKGRRPPSSVCRPHGCAMRNTQAPAPRTHRPGMVYRTQGIPERHARLAADLDGARQIGEMSFANLDERVLRLPGPTVPDRVVDGCLKQSSSPAGPGRVPPKRYPDEGSAFRIATSAWRCASKSSRENRRCRIAHLEGDAPVRRNAHEGPRPTRGCGKPLPANPSRNDATHRPRDIRERPGAVRPPALEGIADGRVRACPLGCV
jgi:hypothetical protein